MSEQPFLLDVPKMAKRRSQIAKEQIEAVKARCGIWTCKSKNWRREDHPWQAMLLPGNPIKIEIPYEEFMKDKGPWEIIAGYCRVLDEAGVLTTGETEREAINEILKHIQEPIL